ncbi:MAG TPA: MraY family glycosyltransferase [Candidatus Bipolaricaulota bacterium]|nr:MraY family glycosyltransferase [Candidatus Bipolaricaulota bacterium]
MNAADYIAAAAIAFMSGVVLTITVRFLAKKLKILDYPNSLRKIHHKPVPKMGGLALFLAFNAVILIYVYFTKELVGSNILIKYIWGLLFGGAFLMLGGILDDKYNLKPKYQIIWPILAVISVGMSGIGIDWISNPFGDGIWHLAKYQIDLLWFHGIPYRVTFLADLFTFIWLMGMMYTTKILDGLDGLVGGITTIGALFIFAVSLMNKDVQPDVALLAIIFAGVCLGFLIFNFHPASIFLGEGGSTYTGFVLGTLSIISGSKVTVTLMLLSLPILDVAWTLIRRKMEKKSFSFSDKKHLHHRLLDAGFGVKRASVFLWLISAILAGAALYLQTKGLAFLILGMAALLTFMLIMAFAYKKAKELREKE